jgi:hypothetical protein
MGAHINKTSHKWPAREKKGAEAAARRVFLASLAAAASTITMATGTANFVSLFPVWVYQDNRQALRAIRPKTEPNIRSRACSLGGEFAK